MKYKQVILLFVVGIVVAQHGNAQNEEWSKIPEEVPLLFYRVHVLSDVITSQNNSVSRYKVDTWYFEHEMIVRAVSDKKTNMLAYEDKLNSVAKYWEDGFDQNTPYFLGSIMDGKFLEIAGYGDYWLHQKPVLKFGIERSSRKMVSDDLTTITYRSRYPGMQVVSYQSAVFKGGKLQGWEMAGDIDGDYNVVSYRTFSDYDTVTSMPKKTEYKHFFAPFQTITHTITNIEPISDNVNAKDLLLKLSAGYRPVKKKVLNDTSEGAGYGISVFSVWLIRILLACAAFVILNYLYSKFIRKEK